MQLSAIALRVAGAGLGTPETHRLVAMAGDNEMVVSMSALQPPADHLRAPAELDCLKCLNQSSFPPIAFAQCKGTV